MPFFRSKFQPKKCPPRKTSTVSNLRCTMDTSQLEREFGIQVSKVRLDLGDNYLFEFDPETHSKWVLITQANTRIKPSAAIQKLEGENNWLKIQAELLLDMLTETTLEAHLKTMSLSEDNPELSQTKKSSFKGRRLFT